MDFEINCSSEEDCPAQTSALPILPALLTPSPMDADRVWSSPAARTPIRTALYLTTLMVIRLGGDLLPNNDGNAALPIFADYIDVSTGTVLRSLPMRSFASENGGACTLGHGTALGNWNYNTDGLPSNTEDGRFVIVPCFNTNSGDTMTMMGSKTIALIGTNFSVVYSRALYPYIDTAQQSGFLQVASSDATSYWMAGSSRDHSGFRYYSSLTARTSMCIHGASCSRENYAVRGIGVYNGILYGSAVDAGIATLFRFSHSSPLPSSVEQDSIALRGLPLTMSPWTFIFESPTSLWVSVDDSDQWPGAIRHFELRDDAWGALETVTLDSVNPTYSITGRVEGSSFVLYAASCSALFRYDSEAATSRVIAVPAAGQHFRGVALPVM